MPESPATGAALRRASVPGDLAQEGQEVGFFDLLNPLLRQRRLIVVLPLAAAALTMGIALLLPPLYTATTTFIPETKSQAALPQGLVGLAGQFGIALQQPGGQGPRFYAEVARSREILERVLLTRYAVPGVGPSRADSATLLGLLHAGGRNAVDSLEKAMEKLDGRLTVTLSNPTNIVSLSVEAGDPLLAAAVANRFVEYLNAFNTQNRQSQARERRKFVEQRVTDAAAQLRQAEETIRTFVERNRGWQEAPELVLEEARLRRQVTISQDIYLTLRREFETARIEEVNDTPVITLIDAAIAPQRKSWPKVGVLTLLALVVGTMISCVLAYVADYVNRARREDGLGHQEFTRLLRQAQWDVARLFRRPLPRP